MFLKIIIKIPYLPLVDQEKNILDIFIKQLKQINILYTDASFQNDPLYFIFNVNLIDKISEHNIITLIEKTFSAIKWSITLSFGSKSSRPITDATIIYNNDILKGKIFDIELTDKLKDIKILSYEERMKKIQTLIPNQIPDSLLAKNLSVICNPKIVQITIPDQYLFLGNKILAYFLEKEHLAHLYHQNKVILFIEDHVNIDEKKFLKSIEAKLIDVVAVVKKDLQLTVEDYQNILKTKIYRRNISVYQQLNLIENISKKINTEININALINIYKLDISSRLVSDNPELEGEILKMLLPDQIHNINLIYDNNQTSDEKDLLLLSKAILNLEEALLADKLPTSSQDPWGMKREILVIAKYFIKHKILSLNYSIKNEILEKIHKKTYELLVKNNNDLFYLPIDKAIYYQDLKINQQILLRIKNLILESKKHTNNYINIENNDFEANLLKEINNFTALNNENNIFIKIETYLNNHTIIPYVNRIKILEKFIEKYQEFIG